MVGLRLRFLWRWLTAACACVPRARRRGESERAYRARNGCMYHGMLRFYRKNAFFGRR